MCFNQNFGAILRKFVQPKQIWKCVKVLHPKLGFSVIILPGDRYVCTGGDSRIPLADFLTPPVY